MSSSSLRILLLNHNWFANELRALGHEVFTAGWAHESFDIPYVRLTPLREILANVPQAETLNAIIYFDDSFSVSVRGLEEATIPLIFYSIDTHHHWRWHCWLAPLFDRILVAQKNYVSVLYHANPELASYPIVWFPLWAPIDLSPGNQKSIDVSFRGTLNSSLQPERAQFFERLGRLTSVDVAEGPYSEVYQSSKVVVNQSVADDLNFRVFEALMSGAALVTPRVSNGMSDLFQEGVELLAYERGNAEDAAEKISLLLNDDSYRERIAKAGRELILRSHTAQIRAAQLCEEIKATARRVKPLRRVAAALSYLHGLETFREAEGDQSPEASEYRKALVFAMRDNLLHSEVAGASDQEQVRALLLTCKCYLELVETREHLLRFSKLLASRYPEDVLISLAYLDDLLTLGERQAAEDLAAQISNSPQELLASVPQLIADVRKRVMEKGITSAP